MCKLKFPELKQYREKNTIIHVQETYKHINFTKCTTNNTLEKSVVKDNIYSLTQNHLYDI